MRFLLSLAFSVLIATTATVSAADKVVNVYNWSDYVAEDTLSRFEEETGIKVNYDVYDSNQMLEAKLLAGRSGYDVVFPSLTPFLAQQIKSGVYQKLDKSKLPNYAGLSQTILAAMKENDPGNAYSAPYMWAATGIGYNVDKVVEILGSAPRSSWGLLFDPAITAKLKACGITLIDDPVEVVPAVLSWQGKNPVSQDEADLKAAMTVLQKIRANLRYIHSSSYINDLANGDICVAHGYVGDLIQARERAKEAGNGVNILVLIPEEGAPVNIDAMAIPADAPNVANAHVFINFMMRPDIVAAITNETGYANAVPASMEMVDEEIANDPAIFPPGEVRAKEFSTPPAPRAYERTRTRAWNGFKTGM